MIYLYKKVLFFSKFILLVFIYVLLLIDVNTPKANPACHYFKTHGHNFMKCTKSLHSNGTIKRNIICN